MSFCKIYIIIIYNTTMIHASRPGVLVVVRGGGLGITFKVTVEVRGGRGIEGLGCTHDRTD